jgi:CheY-like chemotaxis protein
MNSASATKVLVVEDDPEIQALAEAMLGGRGYDVRLASNGAVGLEQVLTFRPEVVLFDFWMPVADGRALVQGVREVARARVGLACMSATPEVSDWCARVGVSAFVLKPFTGEELCDAVGRALEEARASSVRMRAAEPTSPSSRPRRDRAVLLVGGGAPAREVRARLREGTPLVQVAAVESPDDAVRVLGSISVDAIAICGDGPLGTPDAMERLLAEGEARKLPVLHDEGDAGHAAGEDRTLADRARDLAARLRAILSPR